MKINKVIGILAILALVGCEAKMRVESKSAQEPEMVVVDHVLLLPANEKFVAFRIGRDNLVETVRDDGAKVLRYTYTGDIASIIKESK